MYSTDIGLLRANLQEMTVAMVEFNEIRGRNDQGKALQDLPLRVVSLNKICHNRSWRTFCDRFFGEEQPLSDSQVVIKYTLTTLFNRCVKEACYESYKQLVQNWVNIIDESTGRARTDEICIAQRQRYRAYISDAFGVDNHYEEDDASSDFTPIDSKKVDRLKQLITSCSNAVRPFWELWINKKNAAFIGPVVALLAQEEPLIIDSEKEYQYFKQMQSIIDIEGSLECELPIVSLAKLHQAAALSEDENEQLMEWLQVLNIKKNGIPLPLLEEALIEVVSIINIQSDRQTTVDRLIMELADKGCTLFSEEDYNYMCWRDVLKPGETIYFNQQPLILGEELESLEDEDDEDYEYDKQISKHRVFTLIEYPDCVAVIGRNRFQLMIESARSEIAHWHWGSRFVDSPQIGRRDAAFINGLDSERRYLLTERLTEPLKNMKWPSPAFIHDRKAVKKAMVLANHVYCMHKRHAIPENLDVKSFMFNAQGLLKSTKLTPIAPFNYNTLEKFCCVLANGDPQVLDFIMRVSQLTDHEVAEFYRGAVLYTLMSGETDLASRALSAKNRHGEYEERARKLCEEAMKMREKSADVVMYKLRKEKFDYPDGEGALKEEIMKRVSSRLVGLYATSSTPGIMLSKEIRKQAMNQVITSFLRKVIPVAIREVDVDYGKYHDLMMEYNKIMLESDQRGIHKR